LAAVAGLLAALGVFGALAFEVIIALREKSSGEHERRYGKTRVRWL